MRSAIGIRRESPVEPGSTDHAKRAHATHVLTEDGSRCKVCGTSSSWDRIARTCPNRINARKRNGGEFAGLKDAERIALRAKKLRGER